MADKKREPPTSGGESFQRWRFRVVAPDGRELVSDIVQVHLPTAQEGPSSAAEAAAQQQTESPKEPVSNFRVKNIFVAVHGRKQGAFKGESPQDSHQHQFAALSLEYEVKSPRDAASGQASGKRRHLPVAIAKEWGPATPQLFQALLTDEVLDTIEIDCFGVSEQGQVIVVHKVKLTNGTVASIKQVAGTLAAGHGDLHDLETVAFTFEKIEHFSPTGLTLAIDDLKQ